MEIASEQRWPRTDIAVVEAAIEQLKAISSKEKGRRAAAKRVLAEDVKFLSALRRCLIADQPALVDLLKIGPDIIFNALSSQDVPLKDVEGIAARLLKSDTDAARQLWLSLIAYCIGIGSQPDMDWFVTTPETSLPRYASTHASGLFTYIQAWLEDDNFPAFKKRKLAAILIRSLPNFRASGNQHLSMMPRIIRSLRKSRVDPGLFSAEVLRDWTDQTQRLPPAVAIDLAQVLSEQSDGYLMLFWDDKQLGPLSALLSKRQLSRENCEEQLRAETRDAADIQHATQPITTKLAELPLEIHSPDQQLGFSRPEMVRSSIESLSRHSPKFLDWLSELHEQIDAVLQIARENEQLKQQLFEAERTLAASERNLQETVDKLTARNAAVAEVEAKYDRLHQLHEEESEDLKKQRSRSEWLEGRIVDLENLARDAESRMAVLKAELDEAPRSRILYGEQRAEELKNSLRGKISAEASGLPSLAPDLSQDHFQMLRVRFRNLLKLLHEAGLLTAIPGDPAP